MCATVASSCRCSATESPRPRQTTAACRNPTISTTARWRSSMTSWRSCAGRSRCRAARRRSASSGTLGQLLRKRLPCARPGLPTTRAVRITEPIVFVGKPDVDHHNQSTLPRLKSAAGSASIGALPWTFTTTFDTKLEGEWRYSVPNGDLVPVVKRDVPTAPLATNRRAVDSRSAHAAAIGEDEPPLNEVDAKMLARHVIMLGGLEQEQIIERHTGRVATIDRDHRRRGASTVRREP